MVQETSGISHTGCSASRGQNGELDPNPNLKKKTLHERDDHDIS
jgi:hypothetical protein